MIDVSVACDAEHPESKAVPLPMRRRRPRRRSPFRSGQRHQPPRQCAADGVPANSATPTPAICICAITSNSAPMKAIAQPIDAMTTSREDPKCARLLRRRRATHISRQAGSFGPTLRPRHRRLLTCAAAPEGSTSTPNATRPSSHDVDGRHRAPVNDVNTLGKLVQTDREREGIARDGLGSLGVIRVTADIDDTDGRKRRLRRLDERELNVSRSVAECRAVQW